MRKFLNNDILVQIVTIIQYCGICLLFIFLQLEHVKNYIKERSEWINNMSKVQSYKQLYKNSEDFEDV